MQENSRLLIILSTAFVTILCVSILFAPAAQIVKAEPSLRDTRLNVHAIGRGLSLPTSLVFLDNANILVTEKSGQVRWIRNGILQEEPVLQVNVDTEGERGLLGIAAKTAVPYSLDNSHNDTIFLFYTEADSIQIRNRVYKYEWDGQSLIKPSLIFDLPAEDVGGKKDASPYNVGGKVVIGPDGYLYAVIGDLDLEGQLQNFPKGVPPDLTGSIFRINTTNGEGLPDNPFANSHYIVNSKYYAYGIANSLGMDFDPITGNLWDTESGSAHYSEINLVKPGFNSGSKNVMGPISANEESESNLVMFPDSYYADPLLSWNESVLLTDIEFLESTELGNKYANGIFVGDGNGNLYFSEVNENRDGVKVTEFGKESGLSDLVVDNEDELSSITFGSGFGGISDIETGPNGLLFVMSYDDGTIYEISNATN